MDNFKNQIKIFTKVKNGKEKYALFRNVYYSIWIQLTPWLESEKDVVEYFELR